MLHIKKKKRKLASPNPIAAQHSTVTTDRVTLRLVIECAGLGFRSQQRVNKYNNKPNSDTINKAAGTEPNKPKLCNKIMALNRIRYS